MASFVRPPIDDQVFRDADGRVIDYGHRWFGAPPDDTYSVDTHPERFQPLHAVADALITHLVSTYDVRIEEGVELAADLMRPPFFDVLRAVRLRPSDPRAATLTVVFTAYPGIYLQAGVLSEFHYPVCGCDACDSTWNAEAGDLELTMLAVAEGRFRETLALHNDAPWGGYALTFPGGSSSGGSNLPGIPRERLARAAATLAELPGGWTAWPAKG